MNARDKSAANCLPSWKLAEPTCDDDSSTIKSAFRALHSFTGGGVVVGVVVVGVVVVTVGCGLVGVPESST